MVYANLVNNYLHHEFIMATNWLKVHYRGNFFALCLWNCGLSNLKIRLLNHQFQKNFRYSVSERILEMVGLIYYRSQLNIYYYVEPTSSVV